MALDLAGLRLSSLEPLRTASRQPCPSCDKSCAAYCCDCCLGLVEGAPRLRLPVKVEVVQHGETNARGTGVHAALLAPEDAALRRHASGTGHHRRQDPLAMQLPDYDPATTVVLFPESKDTDVVGQCPPFERVVVLDGSWRKARAMLQHPALARLRRVQLPLDVRTVFWRRGTGDFRGAVDEGVSTIEAIHRVCCTLDPAGCYDDLLWYFVHVHGLIQAQGGPACTRTKQSRAQGQQLQQQQQRRGQEGPAGAEEADSCKQQRCEGQGEGPVEAAGGEPGAANAQAAQQQQQRQQQRQQQHTANASPTQGVPLLSLGCDRL